MDCTQVVGKCLDMCPKSEVQMRKKEGLLHRLEKGPDFQPVKEYSRSAAGLAKERPCNIRPPDVLQTTLTYLFNTVVTVDTTLEVFTFVSNRLRSIKQDLFKQQCLASIALPILEPIVRYYAWAAYWYCEEPAFEQHLHDISLLECLKECLRLADRDNFPASDDIEGLYILYTLGLSNGILRATNFLAPHSSRFSPIPECYKLSLYWYNGNYTAVCKNIKILPLLLAAFVSVKHLESVRRHGLAVMSNSYCCKNMITPWDALEKTHMFANKSDAMEVCKFYSITYDDEGVIFCRGLSPNNSQKNFQKLPWIQKELERTNLVGIFFNEQLVDY